ncbi:CapA family protein [Photobacterium swingsii]|uniref:CapA family protein n=1 Tax=Photobacterium swingsii TaxID=680026 RepID=UPI003D0DA6DC
MKLLFSSDYAPNTKNTQRIDVKKSLSAVKHIFNTHDFCFTNIEAPVTYSEGRTIKNGPNLKIEPDDVQPLLDIGVNIIGLANNHIMDYGVKGLEDTLDFFKSQSITTIGCGRNLESALSIKYFDKDGIKIALIALAENEFGIAGIETPGIAPLEVHHNYYQIKEAKENADVVIVTMHAGNEHYPLPRPNLRKLCHLYIDMGVDVIVNHHNHITSAFEKYNGSYIYYGMGNFLFNTDNKSEAWNEGFFVSLTIERIMSREIKITSDIYPYQQKFNSGVVLLKDSKLDNFKKKINNLNDCLTCSELFNSRWKDFCSSNRDRYIFSAFFPYKFKGLGKIESIFKLSRLILNSRAKPVALNMIECQSHHEVLVSILKSDMNNESI